jgi:formyltetrahydrofolate deformylase
MQIIVTALGSSCCGLVDPIVHAVTDLNGFICEIQMHDHEFDDGKKLFAMLLRARISDKNFAELEERMSLVFRKKKLKLNVWAKDSKRKKRVVVLTTHVETVPQAVIEGVKNGTLDTEIAALIGNRETCKPLASKNGIPWHLVGDGDGVPNNEQLLEILADYKADFIVMARYMRILPPEICWYFGGGRIINLHHGLLPSFPGGRPYHDAYGHHMLTYGATCHFIVPELDAGDQIIHQSTFTVEHQTPLSEIIDRGQTENEPECLVQGLSQVLKGRVELQFNKVQKVNQNLGGHR